MEKVKEEDESSDCSAVAVELSWRVEEQIRGIVRLGFFIDLRVLINSEAAIFGFLGFMVNKFC